MALGALSRPAALRPPGARMGGAALWTVRLDRSSPVALSRQLAAALREAIPEGRLAAGARLPSTRALAADLGLARSTVVGVFEQLTAEGFIAARPGSGHAVPERPEERSGVAAGRAAARRRVDPARPAAAVRDGPYRGRRAPDHDLEAPRITRAFGPLAGRLGLWRPPGRRAAACRDRRVPRSGARRALPARADRDDLRDAAGTVVGRADPARPGRRRLGRGPVLPRRVRHPARG